MDPNDAPRDTPAAPQTGEDVVDLALIGLADLSAAPLAQHHDELVRAHETLQQALDRDVESPAPGAGG